jgi:hypothetical protein
LCYLFVTSALSMSLISPVNANGVGNIKQNI